MKFKCKHTGNVVEFLQEHDIKTMLQHPDYVQVEEEVNQEEAPKPTRKYNKGQ